MKFVNSSYCISPIEYILNYKEAANILRHINTIPINEYCNKSFT